MGAGLLWIAVAAAQATFEVRLSTVPIEAATAAHVTGQGSVSAALDGTRLSIAGGFRGLQGPATSARVHLGPVTGVRGAPIHELVVERARAGSISGSLELTRAQAEALRQGRLYIQLDSQSAPDGNLWGWLLPE